MDLLILIGSGAVGKMTVGQELMKITDYRLFHNHMMIEPVIEIFGKFDGAVVSRLREDIFDAFIKTDYKGMILFFLLVRYSSCQNIRIRESDTQQYRKLLRCIQKLLAGDWIPYCRNQGIVICMRNVDL